MISYDNYTLIPLPLDGYEPDSMDFKLIINPLYRTATYSDEREIRAVVMDRYRHVMPGAGHATAQRVFSCMLPCLQPDGWLRPKVIYIFDPVSLITRPGL